MRTSALLLLIFILASGQSHSQDSSEQGKASFYHDSFHGQETSNGEAYDKNDFTAAHRTLPFGTILLVTNKKNKKSVIVRVNDRGPFKRSRIIDLSYAAAIKLGMVPFGVVQVRITPLTWLDTPSLNESIFHDNEIWNCYAQKIELPGRSLIIWKTENWKHAFYMASSLTLEKKTDVFVRVSGTAGRHVYQLLIASSDENKLSVLQKGLTKEGFHVK